MMEENRRTRIAKLAIDIARWFAGHRLPAGAVNNKG
jgi:hypothetical protein